MAEPGKEFASETEELALLVNAVQDYALILVGPRGEIRTWNEGAERTFGYTAKEAMQHNFVSLFNVDGDMPLDLDVAARDGRVERDGWTTAKNGRRVWTSTVINAL